jgi:hypothetical protein
MEVVATEGALCIVTAETNDEEIDGEAACLSGRDLSEYDYISVSKDGLIPVSVKLVSMT